MYLFVNIIGLFWLLNRPEQRTVKKLTPPAQKKAAAHLNKAQCAACDQIVTLCSEDLQKWFHSERAEDLSLHALSSYRGKDRQEAHFQAGRSKAHFGESPHNYSPSRALDVVFVVQGQNSWNLVKLDTMAKRAPSNIEWGGYWKDFKDNPHFQEREWKTMVTNFPNGN